jgi:hypothetical protein
MALECLRWYVLLWRGGCCVAGADAMDLILGYPGSVHGIKETLLNSKCE